MGSMVNGITKSIIANLAWRVQGCWLKRLQARFWAAAGEPIRRSGFLVLSEGDPGLAVEPLLLTAPFHK